MIHLTGNYSANFPVVCQRGVRILCGLMFCMLIGMAPARATTSYTESATTFSWLSTTSQTLIVTGSSGGTWSSGANCTTSANGPYDGASPDDDITWPISLGFTFNFGGTNYTSVQVMANGRLEFGSNNQCGYGGPYVQIPTTTGNTVSTVTSIIPYSMDFDPDPVDTGGGTTCTAPNCGVFYGTGTNASGVKYFVVTWRNNPGYAAQTPTYTVQAILYADGSFEFQYQNNTADPPTDSNGNLPAIGWEIDASHYFQHSTASLSSLNNTALLYTPVPLDHFNIAVPSAGDYCNAQTINISAADASNNVLTSYTGTVTISTTTGNGSFTVGSPAPNGTLTGSGTASVTYSFVAADAGVIALNFLDTIDNTVQIIVSDAARGITSTSSTITYSNRDFFVVTPDPSSISPTNTVVVGKPYTLTISMHKSGNCTSVDTGYRNNQSVIMWITRASLDPGGAAPVVQDSGGTLTALTLPNANPGSNNVTLNFSNPSNGYANATLTTSAVGKFVLNIEDNNQGGGRCRNASPCDGSSPTLTIRPFALVFTSIKNSSGTANPGNSAATGTIFTGAGQNFSATVTGVKWQSADDTNNDGLPDNYTTLATTPVTSSFAWSTTLASCATTIQEGASGPFCSITPTGGTTGTVSNGTIAQSSFSGGSGTASSLQYSEVGSVMLSAAVTNFLGAPGVNVAGYSGTVGRFVPDHFDVTAVDGCNVTSPNNFTWSGQPFGLISVTASNASDSKTKNYTGTFAKNVTISDTSGAAGSFSANSIASSAFASGLGTSSSIAYRFASTETAPATLILRATDTDGISSASSGTEPNMPVKAGRVRLRAATGSELLTLPLPLTLETYQSSTSGWQAEQHDTCTTSGSLSFAPSYLSGSGALPNGTTSVLSVTMPASGNSYQGNVLLKAPGSGNTGDVDIVGTVPAWLQFDWTTSGTLANPSARASFGVYQGNSHQIYIRVTH